MIMAIIYLKELFVMSPYQKAYKKKQKMIDKKFRISSRKRRKIEKCLDEIQEHLDDFCVKSERIDIAQKIKSFRRLVRRYSIE